MPRTMGILGKLLGGFAGFAMGGPVGAMVGAALGHAADQRNEAGTGLRPPGLAEAEIAVHAGGRQTLYSIAVVILAAKVAKADGTVTRAEIDAFKRVFGIRPDQVRAIGTLFDEARESADGYEIWARRLGEAFGDEPGALEDVLAALLQVAVADGATLHPKKQAMLESIRRQMRLSDAAYARARAGGTRIGANEPDPYAVLGVASTDTEETIREAWMRLVRESHPDALRASGLPDHAVEAAQARVARVNAAWTTIKAHFRQRREVEARRS
jgi:DnaJ like chaperone protein